MIERGVYPDRVGVLVAGMELETDSITERLEELGVVFADAEHVIDAVAATAEDARLLGVRPRMPMLRERRPHHRSGRDAGRVVRRPLPRRRGRVQRPELGRGQRAVPHA